MHPLRVPAGTRPPRTSGEGQPAGMRCVIALGSFAPRAYYPPLICGMRASPRGGGTAAAV